MNENSPKSWNKQHTSSPWQHTVCQAPLRITPKRVNLRPTSCFWFLGAFSFQNTSQNILPYCFELQNITAVHYYLSLVFPPLHLLKFKSVATCSASEVQESRVNIHWRNPQREVTLPRREPWEGWPCWTLVASWSREEKFPIWWDKHTFLSAP